MSSYHPIPEASTSNLLPIIKKRPLGPPPDLTERIRLKSEYATLQKRYFVAARMKADLTLEVEEKSNKVQRLQDEVDMIIDQIYDSDYQHLAPLKDTLFSDDDDDEEEEDDPEALETDATRLARQIEVGAIADEMYGNNRDDGEEESDSGVEGEEVEQDGEEYDDEDEHNRRPSKIRKAPSSDYADSPEASDHKRARLS